MEYIASRPFGYDQSLTSGDINIKPRRTVPHCPACNCALAFVHIYYSNVSNISARDRNTFLLLLSKSYLIQVNLIIFFDLFYKRYSFVQL